VRTQIDVDATGEVVERVGQVDLCRAALFSRLGKKRIDRAARAELRL
jgi:hypothetical protein